VDGGALRIAEEHGNLAPSAVVCEPIQQRRPPRWSAGGARPSSPHGVAATCARPQARTPPPRCVLAPRRAPAARARRGRRVIPWIPPPPCSWASMPALSRTRSAPRLWSAPAVGVEVEDEDTHPSALRAWCSPLLSDPATPSRIAMDTASNTPPLLAQTAPQSRVPVGTGFGRRFCSTSRVFSLHQSQLGPTPRLARRTGPGSSCLGVATRASWRTRCTSS